MIEAAKISTILISESKKKVGRLKHRNKRTSEKYYVLIKKDISVVKNTLLRWILQNILENQTFQRIAKYGLFLQNGLHERYYHISKSR